MIGTFLNIPEYEVYTKKCKHDDAIANDSCGIADLVEEEKPLIHQPARDREPVLVVCSSRCAYERVR